MFVLLLFVKEVAVVLLVCPVVVDVGFLDLLMVNCTIDEIAQMN